jgi:hypothetical protein
MGLITFHINYGYEKGKTKFSHNIRYNIPLDRPDEILFIEQTSQYNSESIGGNFNSTRYNIKGDEKTFFNIFMEMKNYCSKGYRCIMDFPLIKENGQFRRVDDPKEAKTVLEKTGKHFISNIFSETDLDPQKCHFIVTFKQIDMLNDNESDIKENENL